MARLQQRNQDDDQVTSSVALRVLRVLLSDALTDITNAAILPLGLHRVAGQRDATTRRYARSLYRRLQKWATDFQGAQEQADRVVDMIYDELRGADYSGAVRALQIRIAELYRGISHEAAATAAAATAAAAEAAAEAARAAAAAAAEAAAEAAAAAAVPPARLPPLTDYELRYAAAGAVAAERAAADEAAQATAEKVLKAAATLAEAIEEAKSAYVLAPEPPEPPSRPSRPSCTRCRATSCRTSGWTAPS